MRLAPAPLAILVSLATLALAGCAGDAAGTSPLGVEEPAVAVELDEEPTVLPPHETFQSHGVTGTEVATAQVGGQASPNYLLEFEAQPGATGILFELTWNDTSQDMDPGLAGPKQCFDFVPFPESTVLCFADIATSDGTYCYWAQHSSPEGLGPPPARVVVDAKAMERCKAGDWYAWASTRLVNTQLPFSLYATVFYDGTDPATFSAIPA